MVSESVSISYNSIDVNSSNKIHSNSKHVNNINSEKATDTENKYMKK